MSNKIHDIRIGLEIFERRGGSYCDAQHDEFFAGQPQGSPLTLGEITTLVHAGWRPCPDGCADSLADGTFPDPRNGPGDPPRFHRFDCSEWAIFT